MDENQYVCTSCIGDEIIRLRIEELGSVAFCSYCGEKGLVVDFEELAVWVDVTYRACFKLSNYDFDDSGESSDEVINNMLKVDNCSIGEDLSAYLSSLEHRAVSKGDDPMYEAGQSYVHQDIDGIEQKIFWTVFSMVSRNN